MTNDITMNNENTQDSTRMMSGKRYEAFYKASGLPLRYMYEDITLYPDTIDKETFRYLKKAHDQCTRFFGSMGSMFIVSQTVGNGKTSWAIKIMKRYMQEHACYYDLDCLFINVPEFLALRKSAINNVDDSIKFHALEKRVKEAKLVVFDDFGCGNTSDFDETFLYTIIDYRWRNGLSGIYTSNVSAHDLRKTMGDRIVDRVVYDSKTCKYWLRGSSRRNMTVNTPQVSKPTPVYKTPATPEISSRTPITTTFTDEVF